MPEALLVTRQKKLMSLKQLVASGSWRSGVKIVEAWVHARPVGRTHSCCFLSEGDVVVEP